MNHFALIESEAMGTNGVFTYRTAKQLGIHMSELSRWIKNGRIVKAGRGVYRLAAYPARGDVSNHTALLAEVGEGSFLWGETALGFLNLCPVRAYVAFVATPRRVRKNFADGVVIKKARPEYKPFYPDGVACQRVTDAIRDAKETVDVERLEEAISAALDKGFITNDEAKALSKEISDGQATA